eukprot:278807_1
MSASDDQLIEEICRRTEKLRLLRSLGPDQGLPLIPRSERLSRSAKTFTHDPANATVATRAAFTAEIETLQYNSEWSSRAIVTNQADNANISKKLEKFKKKSREDAKFMDQRMVEFDKKLSGNTASIKKVQRCAALNSRNVAENRVHAARFEKKTNKEFDQLKDRISKLEAKVQETKRKPTSKVVDDGDSSEETTLASRFLSALGLSDK